MFSGIVEEIGRVRQALRHSEGLALEIEARTVVADLQPGDSVAVNGVCLTVTSLSTGAFRADVMPQTARLTTLGGSVAGQRVNLERALRLGDRIGGHFVSGHIDGKGRVTDRFSEGNAIVLRIEAPRDLSPYIIPRGSVAVDGVSLTVARCEGPAFLVSLIPHTANATTLGFLRPGQEVNLEADMIAKHLAHLLANLRGQRETKSNAWVTPLREVPGQGV